MNIEIIRHSGDLGREVWGFNLSVGYSQSCIYFDSYSFQTKETTRHRKWVKQTHWGRLDQRSSNIERPILPSDIEAEVRNGYQDFIMTLPVKV